MNRLFGKKKKEEKPQVDVKQARENLKDKVGDIDMKVKQTENQMNELVNQAKAKKNAGDQRGALAALRKKKLLEKRLATLEGQSVMMEQQLAAIEDTDFNQGIFDAMKQGQQTLEAVQQKVNVDEMQDLTDKIADQMEQQEEL